MLKYISNKGGQAVQRIVLLTIIFCTIYYAAFANMGNSIAVGVRTYNPELIAGSISPASANINYHTYPGLLTGTAATGGNGTYSYQWQTSANGSSWTNISGAIGQDYYPDPVDQLTYFRRAVSSDSVTVYSNTAVINVYPLLINILPNTYTTYLYGASSFTAYPAVGGNGTYSYQWQRSANNSTWTDISGATSLSYAPKALTATTYFRLKVTSSGLTVNSNTITAILPLNGGSININTATIASGGGITLSSVQAASGSDCSSYAYQWQSSIDGYNWTNISSAIVNGITKSTWFRRQATCGTNTVASNTVSVRVRDPQSQVIPNTLTAAPGGTAPVAAMPPYVAGTDPNNMNYVRTRTFTKSGITDQATADAQTNAADVQQLTAYLDGLGRPRQTVAKQATPAMADLITTNFYDPYGRELRQYLPYTDNGNSGNFRTDAASKQPAFYNTQYNNQEGYYYNSTIYEASPLNRVLESTAPGRSWTGQATGASQQDRINTQYDSVVVWDINLEGSLLPTQAGYYVPGTLYVHETTDEHNNKIIEYKDFQGHIILKKVQLPDQLSPGYTGWLCTYYVYDDLDRLRFVIPPRATEIIRSNWTITAAIANELCFQYRYDQRNRTVMKKVPGADSTEMVYDIRDRLVFTRDGNLKADGQWLASFYDEQNRPVMTALYNSNTTRSTLQASLSNVTSGTQTFTHSIPGIADLVTNNHDGRAKYIARNSIAFEGGFDTGINGETDTEINSTANQDTFSMAVSNPLPGITSSALLPLTYTFYDDYSFTDVQPPQSGDFDKPQAGSNQYAEAVAAVSKITRGRVTGSRIKVLGTTDQWLTSTTYYNDKGRVIQTISDNISRGQDVITNLYDFSGKLLSSYLRQKNLRSATSPQTTLLTMLHYDAGGRVDSLKKRLNDLDSLKRTIAFSSYNELGQLKSKRLGATSTGQIETLNYEYNIRGWLKGINKGFVTPASSTSNWFGQELSYDYGFSANQYNGNIAGIKWKSKGDNIARAYGYSYDNANRLTIADFNQQNNGSTNWTRDQADFTVNGLAYDANGNILSMKQRGMNGANIQTIDSLKYGYLTNSNKLSFVTDGRNNTQSQLGDFKEINNNETADYDYDLNGNLLKDLNKNIAVITYNHLNLPDSIAITGKGNIKYVYDAAGNKLRKVVTDNTGTSTKITVTDYLNGGIVYRNDTLELIGHEEGRIRPVYAAGQPVKYYYDYFLKDHLGNVRTVLTEQTNLSTYTATMEAANASTEVALFSNVDETRAEKPVGYPEDQVVDSNQYVAKLNAKNGKKIGPSLVLKVMAGDTIQIGARAFYKSNGPKDNKSVSPEDMVAGLLQAFGGEAASNGSHANRVAERVTPFGNFNSNDYQRLKERDADQNQQDKPKAYLNFVLFDDQFNLVEENSGVRQVNGQPDELQTLAVDKMPVTKSGFLYVYTSNETEQDVLFDNVTVAAVSGPLLEETHYYPYGLTMAGISSNALKGMNYPENRKKYNGIEFTEDLEIDIYDAFYRNLDPQIGRWNQIDPKIENMEMWSPYASNYDNPIRYNDFLGDEGDDPTKKGFIQGVRDGFIDYFKNIGNAVSHPVETVKAAFSPKALLNNALEASTVGTYGIAIKAYNNLQTIAKEGVYGAGKIVGDKGAEVAVAIGTEGLGKVVSAIKGIGKIEYVYRFDTRPLSEIKKAGGFNAWGNDMDLLQHANGTTTAAKTSGYVATTTLDKAALEIGENSMNGGYLYKIAKPKNGIDVNKALGSRSPFPWEREYAVPGRIPFNKIKSVTPVRSN